MPQLCNGLAPEERADILRVRPQGALCIFMLYRLFKYWILRQLSILDAT